MKKDPEVGMESMKEDIDPGRKCPVPPSSADALGDRMEQTKGNKASHWTASSFFTVTY